MKIKKIVYDVDDVLWGLNKRVANAIGIDENNITHFVIKDNYLLTKEQQEAILVEYNKDETFDNIEWYEGIEDILKPVSLGIDVSINSNCLTEKMAELKTTQLMKILNISKEKIRCNVIDHSVATKKKIDKDTDILVEDSPFNISISPAKLNILINHPWNASEHAIELIKGKNVIRVDTLKEANELIYNLCLKQKSA